MATLLFYYLAVLITGVASEGLQCRFEDGKTCSWQNSSSNGRYTWITSLLTSETGHYLYAYGEGLGRVAELLSKPHQSDASGYVCMKFRYCISGLQAGTLSISSKRFLARRAKVLWVKSGDEGILWNSAKVTIPASMAFQVIFEAKRDHFDATRSSDTRNIIAIDEIEEEPGICKTTLSDNCGIPIKSIGCYEDVTYARTLPKLMASYREIGKGRALIDWTDFKSSVKRLLCECASLAKAKGYKYIGLQFYGECWSGNGRLQYNEYGKARRCVTGDFDYKECSGSSDVPCVGGANMNYVYELL